MGGHGTSEGTRRSRRRRACLALLAAGLSSGLAAQEAPRVWRIGILRPGARPLAPDDTQNVGITRALRALGYEEGRNLVVDLRFADGDPERLPGLAREIVAAKADAIVAVGRSAVKAAQDASSTIPIVMFGNFDPIALGIVTNLARPGGNVTGILIAPDGTLAGKRLELLVAVVPAAKRVALLAAEDPAFAAQERETRRAADALGVGLVVATVKRADYAAAFATFVDARADVLLVGAHSYFVRDRREIVARAAAARLPAMYEWREQVEEGGLMSYSTSLVGLHQRIAAQLDRILKGTRAGDLPVEQPTRFEFVVNRKTASALGLMLSPTVRLQVDEFVD